MDPERLQPQRQPEIRKPEMQRPEVQRPDDGPQVRNLGPRPGGAPPGTAGSGQSDQTDQTTGKKPGSEGGSKPSSSGGMLLKVIAVLILAVVGWFYFGRGPSAYTGPPEESAPNYDKNKNADERVPAVFAPQDIDRQRTDAARQAAQRGDPIPGVNNPSKAFVEAVKRGDVTFYAVRAYDTCYEDGDVVTLRLPMGGDIGPIPLTVAGTTVSVPVVTGQPATLSVHADKDGVGGVTLGIQTSGGVWFSKVMAPGESETMNLAIQ
jgi:hypothetical protein